MKRLATVCMGAALATVAFTLTACTATNPSVTNITPTSGVVKADVTGKEGQDLTDWIAYRELGASGWKTTDQVDLGPFGADFSYSAAHIGSLADLDPSTTYQYKICGFFDANPSSENCFDEAGELESEGGTDWATFTTDPSPLPAQLDSIPADFTLQWNPVKLFDSDPGAGDSWDNQLIEPDDWEDENPPSEQPFCEITKWGSAFYYHVPYDAATSSDLPGGSRCESHTLHLDADDGGGVPSQGGEAVYEWSFLIPASVTVPIRGPDKPYTTINQFHGDNQAGYTGGVVVTGGSDPNRIGLRVVGGVRGSDGEYPQNGIKYISSAGADVHVQRGEWYTIRYHVRWSSIDNGFSHIALYNSNDQRIGTASYDDIPTASNVSDAQMFRTGFYPAHVESSGLDMFVANVSVFKPTG